MKKDDEGNLILPKHTTRECGLLEKFLKDDQSDNKDQDDNDGGENLPQVSPL